VSEGDSNPQLQKCGSAVHFPDVAAHIRSCGPCAEDLQGLLHALDGEDTWANRTTRR
jgi:hypothetical protein